MGAQTEAIAAEIAASYLAVAPRAQLVITTANWQEPGAEAYQVYIASYPEKLAHAMIRNHLAFSSFGSREMLAARKEIPLLYENHCRSIWQILGVLLGLNRIYYPGFKWTRQLIEEMAVAPPDLFARFERVFQSDTITGTRELRQLSEEVFDLVEARLPEIDVAAYRMRFREPYPSRDGLSSQDNG